jgi:dCTP deaminase
MSVLSRKKLEKILLEKKLQFEPELDAYQMQPASIDLRIGWSFYIPYTWKFTEKGRVAVVADYLDYSSTHENFQLVKLKPGQYFEILPGESIIASSLEKIILGSGNLIGLLYPRSSSSRRGLKIESGLINPKYQGHLIIPMTNNSHHVIKIYPGERLCQLVFHELSDELTSDEALIHGFQDAKYQNTTPYGLEVKIDKQEEIDLLKQGRIDELKKKTQAIR